MDLQGSLAGIRLGSSLCFYLELQCSGRHIGWDGSIAMVKQRSGEKDCVDITISRILGYEHNELERQISTLLVCWQSSWAKS